MQLRKYQQESIDHLRDGFREGHKRQVLYLATGGGKTVIAGQVIKNAVEKGKRCWFICDSIDLINQTLKTFKSFGLDCGVMQGVSELTAYDKQVQIITAQTLTRRWKLIDKNPQWRPDLIVADEIHIFYKAHREAMGMFQNIPFIGVTATPQAKGLGKHFTNMVTGATTADLMEKEYLCNYEAYGCSSPDLKNIKTVAGDYKQSDLEERVNQKEIVGDVVKTWLRLGENRQTIVFSVSVAHSEALCREFISAGVNAVHIDGFTDKDKREQYLDDLRDGKVTVLCNCKVAVKGVDIPSATCLVLARPTKSEIVHVQAIGRVLRKSPCGKDAIILDHATNLERLGYPEDIIITELDDGEKTDKEAKKKDEIEKEIAAPKPCTNCGFLFTGSITCPNCGSTYIKSHDVEVLEGELIKLESKKKTPAEKRNTTYKPETKQAMLSSFLCLASSGHASHLYKAYFGVFPRNLNKTKGYETDLTMAAAKSFKKSQAIKYANRKSH